MNKLKYRFSCKTLSTGSTTSITAYGSNGLPATPNSISIIGYFKSNIEKVNHPFLVKYLDCYRNKDETITFVCEHFEHRPDAFQTDQCDRLVRCLLDALHYIHFDLNTVHGFICPQAVLLDGDQFKLVDWPFNHVTLFGKLLDVQTFLPKNLQFLSPERIIDFNRKPTQKADVWSLVLTILYLIDDSIRLPKNPADFLLCRTAKDVLRLLNPKKLPADYEQFFGLALEPLVENRSSTDALIRHLREKGLFKEESALPAGGNLNGTNCSSNDSDKLNDSNTSNGSKPPNDSDKENDLEYLDGITSDEIYFFWKLSKGNRKIKDKNNFKPSICSLPKLVKLNNSTSSAGSDESSGRNPNSPLVVGNSSSSSNSNSILNNNNILNDKQIAFLPDNQHILDLDDLVQRFNSLNKKIFYPVLFTKTNDQLLTDSQALQDAGDESILSLPLVIKENDFGYQCQRTFLFKRLVNEQPFTSERLREEAAIDISPYFRAQIWACVLSVSHRDLYLYRRIAKETNINTDRQISVDIPRCHQYNELLSSPSGHVKLKKILKAWLKHNESIYVYWQGLDSLAAPFIMLNFDNEAMAFASFNAFINRYLEGFFCKDNTPTIQEYLALFAHLIMYHDPELFNHLQELNFTPELYAIPWFLTMFTHVLPLYKIVHIWDTLILHDKSFPLFIGFAILKQLRSQLIGYPFNDCILIFSDLPEINIEQCIKNSKLYYRQTPASLTQRNMITLNDLREEVCPRIEIKELIEILSRENNVLIVDGRNEEEVSTLGRIRNSIQIDEKLMNFGSFERIRKQDYEFLVVVGNYELAKRLAKSNVVRVCTLLNCSLPPDYYEMAN